MRGLEDAFAWLQAQQTPAADYLLAVLKGMDHCGMTLSRINVRQNGPDTAAADFVLDAGGFQGKARWVWVKAHREPGEVDFGLRLGGENIAQRSYKHTAALLRTLATYDADGVSLAPVFRITHACPTPLECARCVPDLYRPKPRPASRRQKDFV